MSVAAITSGEMTVFAGVLDTKGPSGCPRGTGSTSAEPGEVARARPRSEARVSAGATDLRMGMVAGIGSVPSQRPPRSGAAGVKKGCLAPARWAACLGLDGPARVRVERSASLRCV